MVECGWQERSRPSLKGAISCPSTDRLRKIGDEGTIFLLVGVCVGAVVLTALAQTTPAAAPRPLADTLAPQRSRSPALVETPPRRRRGTSGRTAFDSARSQEVGDRGPIRPCSRRSRRSPKRRWLAEQTSVVPEESRKRWRIIPLFTAGVVYDDNIFLTKEDRVPDIIWNLSAGLAFQLGDLLGAEENYLNWYLARHSRHIHRQPGAE